ncbi:MAG: redox-sensing transcriptional repressor Rex [Tenericutes bacterium]|nr:redox-sensing transcriptional repressor Rex [Mycoplasmatota bacterium]
MIQNYNSKKLYERLPIYVHFLNSIQESNISSTTISKSLNLGEVQVRKDLALVSGKGRPKIGYSTKNLFKAIKKYMGMNHASKAIIVGFGKLGKALYDYAGFSELGIDIVQAFDISNTTDFVKDIKELDSYCLENEILFGILTVPSTEAQATAEKLIRCGIVGIWNFTSVRLNVPSHVVIQNENLAASLSVLVKSTLDKKVGNDYEKSNETNDSYTSKKH